MAASPHEKLVARWASDEELFTRVWNTLLKETHKSVSLSVARDLLLSRYANQGVDRRAFYAVCPELNDEKIARFVVPELLPKVINVRVAEPEACTRHDRQFVQAQLSNAGVENSNLESTLISRRQDIMHSFFIDVMTVVTKYLAQQSEASAQTEADTPQSNETAASSASTTKSEETAAPRGDSDAHDLDETNLPIIAGMHHAAIICSDYEVSKKFYVETLGFKIIAENFRKNRNSWKLDLAVGDGTQIELFSFPNPPKRVSRPEAQGLRHLAFRVKDLDAACATLQARGVTTLEHIRVDEYTGKRFNFFADPDDLPLELYEM